MKQSHRKLWSILLFLSLLFTQLAVATYACTLPASGFPKGAEVADEMRGMPCEGEAPERSALCVKHCQDDQAASQSPSASFDCHADMAVLYIVPTGTAVIGSRARRPSSAPLRRQTSPPTLLLSPRLRI